MSESGENDLRVTLGSKGSALEEGFAEPDALGIDEETGLDVVDGVDGEVEAVPEPVVEEAFSFGGDSVLDGVDLEIGVEDLGGVGGAFGLGLADVVGSEEELSVEVGDLDVVVVRDGDKTVGAGSESDEGEELEELAAESAGSDEEGLDVSEVLVELGSE